MNILQKKALRIVSNVKYNSHCDPLFKKYKILKVHDLFKLQCIRLAYKNKFSMLPPYHSSKLPLVLFQNRNPQTRQCYDIAIHRHTTNLQKKLINYKIGSLWNNLPKQVKDTSITTKAFCKSIKISFLNDYVSTCTRSNCYSCNQSNH
jgi:hypothetical protein